ncbi:prominin-like protein [Drosophila subobscura]|uniref:prominin-like protein n=1 Tax=Drosophila subobscura TaxID=7241 RepID=UPI00155A8A27|nr:prominin-like protein [Drosophila subobscura]
MMKERICAALFLFVLVTPVKSWSAPDEPYIWRNGYSGHGTTHEKMGQGHFEEVHFTKFVPTTNYSQRTKNPSMWVDIVFKMSRTFFDKMFPMDPTIPRGYIKFLGTDNMKLGPKVDKEDWAQWLNAYWLMWAWVLVQVALILAIPFIGVLYFCLCCFRCKTRAGCPACETHLNVRRRVVLGTCLGLMIALIGCCMVLAFLSNGMLERGLTTTKQILEVGSVDTCNFLKDVSDHVHHLFVSNYEEMETQLVATLKDAPNHLFRDLNDVAEGNAMAELARILNNVYQAVVDTGDTVSLQNNLLRDTFVLREALRGVKRKINFAATVLCGSKECLKFLRNADIEFIDTSRCLHLDEAPSLRKIRYEMMVVFLPDQYRANLMLERLRAVSKKIKDELERVTPPIIRDIRKGGILFAGESRKLQEIIDVVISDIHLGTLRATRAFEDLYDKFNETRYYVVLYISVCVIAILIVLTVALVLGCLAPRVTGVNDSFFTMKLGSYALILAMILIFCVISAMLIVGLFYFIIGSVAYKGACAPLRQQKASALLRQLDAHIDLKKYFSSQRERAAPMSLSSVIEACEGEQFLFPFLREQRIYNVDNLLRVRVTTPQDRNFDPNLDLSKTYLLTAYERDVFLTKSETNIVGLYDSRLFTESICPELTPMDLRQLEADLLRFSRSLSARHYHMAKVAFENEYVSLQSFRRAFHAAIHRDVATMVKALRKADKLLLYQNYNLGDSIKILRQSVLDTEKFIQTKGTAYLATLAQNLTEMVDQQINTYIRMVVHEANYVVGRCQPLSYIYDNGLDLVCNRMVDPINGYWISVVIAAFLLMPVLCVAHRLQCLYKQISLPPIRPVRSRVIAEEPSCPFCRGQPPRMEGGQFEHSDCEEVTIVDDRSTIAPTTSTTTAIINDLESNKDRKNKLD